MSAAIFCSIHDLREFLKEKIRMNKAMIRDVLMATLIRATEKRYVLPLMSPHASVAVSPNMAAGFLNMFNMVEKYRGALSVKPSRMSNIPTYERKEKGIAR